jgi:hypothetical protein
VWDCAAGTGNLLAGLTNKYHIYASTLDQADVNVMHERIDHGAHLLKNNVFQFDFLNDDFIPTSKGGKLPDSLFEIINNDEKRKKLVMYINPPYAEAGTGLGKQHKEGVALNNKTKEKYISKFGKATNEIFVQFLLRIYYEIPKSYIAQFSKLKIIQSSNFSVFRKNYNAKLENLFLTPADTFDNVKGKFPIGFYFWNTINLEYFNKVNADLYDKNGNFIGIKTIYSYDDILKGKINNWLRVYYDKINFEIGIMHNNKTDFQHSSQVVITTFDNKDHTTPITSSNLISMSVYLTVRHCIEANWLNDLDQFLYPNECWESDTEFQNDCLAFALFHGQNRITSQEGVNHWIPFTEREVNAQAKFDSRFMTDFIQGKIKTEQEAGDLFGSDKKSLIPTKPLVFSDEARAVFDAGRALWTYYHAQKFPSTGGVTEGRGGKAGGTIYNPNASLYDIREHFQGRNEAGKMNNKSQDEHYNQLIATLRESLKTLAKKIEPKVYEYGFLKG